MAVSPDAPAEPDTAAETTTETPVVDPRAPRFGQGLTALGLGLGIVFDLEVLVYAVTLVLLLAVVSGWRLDFYALLWRTVVRPALGRGVEPEPAAPHRFARLLGAVGTSLASVCLIVGFTSPGYVIAGAIAGLAALAAITGLCVGCRLYRQVQFVQRLGIV